MIPIWVEDFNKTLLAARDTVGDLYRTLDVLSKSAPEGEQKLNPLHLNDAGNPEGPRMPGDQGLIFGPSDFTIPDLTNKDEGFEFVLPIYPIVNITFVFKSKALGLEGIITTPSGGEIDMSKFDAGVPIPVVKSFDFYPEFYFLNITLNELAPDGKRGPTWFELLLLFWFVIPAAVIVGSKLGASGMTLIFSILNFVVKTAIKSVKEEPGYDDSEVISRLDQLKDMLILMHQDLDDSFIERLLRALRKVDMM